MNGPTKKEILGKAGVYIPQEKMPENLAEPVIQLRAIIHSTTWTSLSLVRAVQILQ